MSSLLFFFLLLISCVTLCFCNKFKNFFLVVNVATVRHNKKKKNLNFIVFGILSLSLARWVASILSVILFNWQSRSIVFGLIAKMAFSVKQKKKQKSTKWKKKKQIQMTNNKRIAGDGINQSQSQYQSITSFPEIKSPLCHLHFHKFYVFRLFFFSLFVLICILFLYILNHRDFSLFFSLALPIIGHFLCDLKIGHYVIAAVDLSHIMFNVWYLHMKTCLR